MYSMQKLPVMTTEGYVRVIAGAGSKVRILERKPENIRIKSVYDIR